MVISKGEGSEESSAGKPMPRALALPNVVHVMLLYVDRSRLQGQETHSHKITVAWS